MKARGSENFLFYFKSVFLRSGFFPRFFLAQNSKFLIFGRHYLLGKNLFGFVAFGLPCNEQRKCTSRHELAKVWCAMTDWNGSHLKKKKFGCPWAFSNIAKRLCICGDIWWVVDSWVASPWLPTESEMNGRDQHFQKNVLKIKSPISGSPYISWELKEIESWVKRQTYRGAINDVCF